jgi:hypothetical protein
MRGKRILIAMAVAGAAFGIASAVQAAIPDSNGIVTACYQTSTSGTPKGTMRAINAENGEFCRFNEAEVELATPGYVQNVVTSTINPTSFMIKAAGPLGPGFLTGNFFCGTGYISTENVIGPTNNTAASGAQIDLQDSYNVGEVVGGVPDTNGRLFANLTANVNLTIQGTCVDGRVFGLPGPVAPIKQAMKQASISVKVN